jgi:hypothetical protein
VLRNTGRGFDDVTATLGAALGRSVVARGAAFGDFDRDGDPDVVLTTNNGPAYLFRNDGGNANHWLNVKLVGRRSNRDGIGGVVRIESRSGKQWNMVRSGSSYCSHSELGLIFGLEGDPTVSRLVVEWPSGARQEFQNIRADQFLTIDESGGIVKSIDTSAGGRQATSQLGGVATRTVTFTRRLQNTFVRR